MKNKIHLILILLITNTGFGQNIEPIYLAKMLFSKEKFNVEKYATGEFTGHPNGQDLELDVKLAYKLLIQTEKTAVVNVTIKNSSSKGLDAYLHFEKDEIWKIKAFRALAMTGILGKVKEQFENMTTSEIDSLINSKKNQEDKMFKTKEDFFNQLENIKLTLALDDEIVKHFKINEKAFERLKNLALKQLETKSTDDERSYKLLENMNSEYKKLLILSISTDGYKLGNSIVFLIGGILDNTVGYFYIKDKEDLPVMNPYNIIMIREIGNGWYMYKTT